MLYCDLGSSNLSVFDNSPGQLKHQKVCGYVAIMSLTSELTSRELDQPTTQTGCGGNAVNTSYVSLPGNCMKTRWPLSLSYRDTQELYYSGKEMRHKYFVLRESAIVIHSAYHKHQAIKRYHAAVTIQSRYRRY